MLAVLLMLHGCATTASAQRWCESFCGDRSAEASESSQHATSVAVCTCRAPVKEQFDREVDRSIDALARAGKP